MKNLKKYAAGTLIVTLLAGLSAPPVLADETNPVRKWVYEDGKGGEGWYFYDDEGNLTEDRIKIVNKVPYAFDENGRMYSDQAFYMPVDADAGGEEIQEEGDPTANNRFAYPDGHLAETGWVKLDAEGSLYDGYGSVTEQPYWYYFKKTDDAGVMVRGISTSTVNAGQDAGKTFAFADDGKMYSQAWVYVDEDGNVLDENETIVGNAEYLRYFQFEGARAENKYLLLDGYWYEFNENGRVDYIYPTATPSDLDSPAVTNVPIASGSDITRPARQVEKIEIMDGYEEVSVVPGEEVSIDFKVTLSTDSNVYNENFKDELHDMWISPTTSGKYSIKITDKENGICRVTYKPNLLTDEGLQLFVDGVASDEVDIYKTMSTSKDQETAISTIMGAWESEGMKASSVKNSILETYAMIDDESTVKTTLAQSDSYAALSSNYAVEKGITEEVAVDTAASQALGRGTVSMAGAALNSDGKETVRLELRSGNIDELTQTFAKKTAFDISLNIDGASCTDVLDFPVKITMPVPEGFDSSDMKLFHIHDSVEEEVPFTMTADGKIEFVTDSFSTYVFAQNTTSSGNSGSSSSGGGSSSGSSSSSQTAGVTTIDSKKGMVNSITGIITGSGAGYSSWEQGTAAGGIVTWKLKYADGTYAAGSIVTREDGTVYDQPAWEMVNGAWYAFGADGFAKSGLIYDTALGGYFYIDINTGMKTGWVETDGQWRYFSTVSDGKKGIMAVDTTVDGWYVNASGIWDGQPQA